MRKQPYLTKGPWARFFGDPIEVVDLPKTENILFPSFLLISFIFNVTIMTYKKLLFKRDSTQSKLNEIIVGNFLNLITAVKIIFFIIICAVVSCLHRYIGQTTGSSKTDSGICFINQLTKSCKNQTRKYERPYILIPKKIFCDAFIRE